MPLKSAESSIQAAIIIRELNEKLFFLQLNKVPRKETKV